MDKYVKKGLGIYKIFLKNKIASSIMMFVSGIMMFIAAVNGQGNDTKSLPMLITSIGVLLTLWLVFRLGYTKANYDAIPKQNTIERNTLFKSLILQIPEALLYMLVIGVGVFLLSNEDLTDKALNLMSGGFTILNGVFGAIYIYQKRDEIDFSWKFRAVLTIAEFALGLVFIILSDSISIGWYIVMGALTSVAGSIEVFSALTSKNINSTIDDGKKIVSIIKNDEEDIDKTIYVDDESSQS